ncbi:MAG: MBOAT family protein, partial [Oscillospiraceae bacterium]
MSYTAPIYLYLFLPVVMLIYNLIPRKQRWIVLLTASYGFFALISRELIIYLLLSTFSIHHFGLWISALQNECKGEMEGLEKAERKEIKLTYQNRQRMVLLLAVILHVGLLLVLKYLNFFNININGLLGAVNIPIMLPTFKFALPIGISFYTLQAVSYMMDVYRGTIKADKNLGRLALFMSFFPQIMEGPICRYSQTAERLFEGNAITYKSMTWGWQRILWGMLKKM